MMRKVMSKPIATGIELCLELRNDASDMTELVSAKWSPYHPTDAPISVGKNFNGHLENVCVGMRYLLIPDVDESFMRLSLVRG